MSERVSVKCYGGCGTYVRATVRQGVVDESTATCSYCADEPHESVAFESLAEGDRVLFADRKEPVTVDTLVYEGITATGREVPRTEGSIRVVAEAHCTGPRGGEIRLELTSTGRTRARIGNVSYTPPITVRELKRVDGGAEA